MALVIEVKVVPSSGMSKIIQDKLGGFTCYLKSPPQDGKANKELIRLWADQLDSHVSQITILLGLSNRKKTLKLAIPLTLEQLKHKLGFICQQVFL